jgi:sugar lactone lactonase YvrE
MNSPWSAVARYFRHPQLSGRGRRTRPAKTRRYRPCLENLEERWVPSASISIADASMNELGMASAFVSAGSGGLSTPKDLVQGPDGNVYVASSATNSVIRYDGTTGALIGTFVSASSGGLTTPFGLAFGPDGNLYVGSEGTNAIYRYNGTTGAFIDTFVAATSGGLNDPKGIVFGADGNLYVSSPASNSILRYQGPSGPSPGSPLPSTGQTGATFVPAGSGGLSVPMDLTFGPDGNLYVENTANSTGSPLAVLKFDGTTGAFLSTFVAAGAGGMMEPRGLAFDQDGRLYVADSASNAVHRYDSTGQYLDDPVVAAPISELFPVGLAFDAQGRLLIAGRNSNTVVRYDRGVTATLSSASATPVRVSYATADGTALAGTHYTAQSGTITFAPGQTTREVLLANHDETALEGNTTFSVQLSNPTGGVTIGTGTATVTRVDDDSTRQFTISNTTATEGDTTGKFLDTFISPGSGPLYAPGYSPGDFGFGPDGNFYVASGGYVLRYNGTTGAFMNNFVTTAAPSERNGPFELLFMPGGDLLVAYQNSGGVVRRFNGTTGADLGAFTSGITLSFPRAMAFGPDGNLYVNRETGANTSEIDRFNGTTGAFMNVFAASGSGGMDDPQGLVFGSDGNLYVSQPNDVLRFNGTTGAFMGNFVAPGSGGLGTARKLAFGPDGNLYVADDSSNAVFRYNGTTGAFIDKYVTSLPNGNTGLLFLTFGPDGNIYVSSESAHSVFRYGANSQAAFTVTLSTPSSLPLTVNFATSNGSAQSGSDYTSRSGTVTLDAGATDRGIIIKSVDDGLADPTKTFYANLSSPVGGTIPSSQAIGTILDDTKFYVVDGGSSDSTYQYAAAGTSLGKNALGSGDTAPRGVAITSAGTTEWVVDANKTVYVYTTGGILLGSWTAGGLSSSATLTGIATNGTDIWLVDSNTDKVYQYAGAASLRSGSQNAASSFSLASGKKGNPNPQDIVTDGTSFWVVDGTALKVFKYTLSGSLLGSWTIDAANKNPTGITINPNNVSDIWIVDNGTKKVYQYSGAASRTSGSQILSAVFALSPNDTNPQGIADPPAAEMLLPPASRLVLPEAPSVVPFNIASARAANAVAATASLANREAVCALAFAESLPNPGERSPGLTASDGSPTAGTDRALTPAGAFGGLNAMDYFGPLTWAAGDGVRSDHRAVDLWDDVWAGDESPLSAGVTDSFFARLEEDAADGE